MKLNIGIINYGVGNVFSVKKILKISNANIIDVNNTDDFKKCDKIIMPGQGSFTHAMNHIQSFNLDEQIYDFIKSGKHLLCICLGMQLLLNKSEEANNKIGLGVLDGEVIKISQNLKSPNINWLNILSNDDSKSKFNKLANNKFYYFAHSYFCSFHKIYESSYSIYETLNFTSLLEIDNIICTQFHPEISGENGKIFFKNFIDL